LILILAPFVVTGDPISISAIGIDVASTPPTDLYIRIPPTDCPVDTLGVATSLASNATVPSVEVLVIVAPRSNASADCDRNPAFPDAALEVNTFLKEVVVDAVLSVVCDSRIIAARMLALADSDKLATLSAPSDPRPSIMNLAALYRNDAEIAMVVDVLRCHCL
jgi:hypothetical protein